MASVDECRAALNHLARRLDEHADKMRGKLAIDRSVACRLTDLGVAFRARLTNGRLVNIADGDDPSAAISLSTNSDDLIALVEGRLDITRALASRRVSICASPFDLLKLRKLL